MPTLKQLDEAVLKSQAEVMRAAITLGRRGGKARAAKYTKAQLSAMSGRPRSADRCKCGKFTAATAKKRGHKC